MDIVAFCSITEAICRGDDVAAECAGIGLEAPPDLSSPKSVVAQEMLRASQDGRLEKELAVVIEPQAESEQHSFSAPASSSSSPARASAGGNVADLLSPALSQLHGFSEWYQVFEDARRKDGHPSGISKASSFEAAMMSIHPHLHHRQVLALWKGFRDGTDLADMGLSDFCEIANAVDIGEEAACEFADLDKLSFQRLAHSDPEESGLRIQSRQVRLIA